MASWSENRDSDNAARLAAALADKKQKLEQINAVIHKISQDDDFYDDLQMPIVQKALNHWTGRNRLPPEEAQELQDNRRVMYVFQRFQLLQSVCYSAGIPVPLNLLLEKKFLHVEEYLERERQTLIIKQKQEDELWLKKQAALAVTSASKPSPKPSNTKSTAAKPSASDPAAARPDTSAKDASKETASPSIKPDVSNVKLETSKTFQSSTEQSKIETKVEKDQSQQTNNSSNSMNPAQKVSEGNIQQENQSFPPLYIIAILLVVLLVIYQRFFS
jgi:hypothetical protein